MMLSYKGMKPYVKLLVWMVFLAVSVAIFLFSEQPAEQSKDLSQTVLTGVLEKTVPNYTELPKQEQDALIKTYHSGIRKAAHFGIYTLWGLTLSLLLFLYGLASKKLMVCVPGGGFLYACSDELHQIFSEGRAAQWSDILLDTAGVLLGLLLFLFIWQAGAYFFKRTQKKP